MTRIVLTVAAGAFFAVAGCEKSLFPPNLPRSQYERFTYQREGLTPQEEESMLGDVEIDLRSRLRPLSER